MDIVNGKNPDIGHFDFGDFQAIAENKMTGKRAILAKYFEPVGATTKGKFMTSSVFKGYNPKPGDILVYICKGTKRANGTIRDANHVDVFAGYDGDTMLKYTAGGINRDYGKNKYYALGEPYPTGFWNGVLTGIIRLKDNTLKNDEN